jgi:LacI family transcriptional regulator
MSNPTIKDVAKMAGTSIATVSRALRNSGYISDHVREAVQKAVQELDYKPNRIAQSLKNNSSFTIGLVVTDITNPFFAEIAKEAENVLVQYGYNLIICNTDESPEKELNHLKMLEEKRVDGILLCSTGKNNDYVRYLIDKGTIIILIDRRYDELDIDIIKDDNEYGALLLTRYLIQKGHTKIALIKGNPLSVTSNDRAEGYRKALLEKNIPVLPEYIHIGGASGEHAADAVNDILALENRPTAIFGVNSLIARHAIMALNNAEIKVPEQMALACYGLEEFKTLYKPSITCMIQKPERFGYTGAQLVLSRINEGYSTRKKEVIFPPELFVGDSV